MKYTLVREGGLYLAPRTTEYPDVGVWVSKEHAEVFKTVDSAIQAMKAVDPYEVIAIGVQADYD